MRKCLGDVFCKSRGDLSDCAWPRGASVYRCVLYAGKLSDPWYYCRVDCPQIWFKSQKVWRLLRAKGAFRKPGMLCVCVCFFFFTFFCCTHAAEGPCIHFGWLLLCSFWLIITMVLLWYYGTVCWRCGVGVGVRYRRCFSRWGNKIVQIKHEHFG